MSETKEILSFAVELGDSMLRNGAEVYRVEDSILAILDSYQITDCDVYVLTNGIFASANETSSDSCSLIRHVPLAPMHLGRIDSLNNLCRQVCEHTISLDDAWEKLDKYSSIPTYSPLKLILATGIGSAGFTYLFGGTVIDAIFSLITGLFLQLFLMLLAKNKTPKAVSNVLGSALVTLLALATYYMGFDTNFDKIIIGAIMPLVPGIALTNSIRDFINGDYLSGSIRLIDALLTSFCIAVGVGIIITLAEYTIGGVLYI